MDANAELPRLRYRERGLDKRYLAPTAVMGDVVDVGLDTVTILIRDRATTLHIEDLHDVLGGPDLAFGILLDAAANRDRVKVGLSRGRITYDNAAQAARFRR